MCPGLTRLLAVRLPGHTCTELPRHSLHDLIISFPSGGAAGVVFEVLSGRLAVGTALTQRHSGDEGWHVPYLLADTIWITQRTRGTAYGKLE